MSMSDELEGRVSLVTGGSGDIGSAIAKRLGQSGSTVVITYVGAEDLASQTVDEIKAEGGNASALRLDQRDPNEIEAIICQISQDQGRLDILQQRRLEYWYPFPKPGGVDRRNLGSSTGNQPPGTLSLSKSCRLASEGRRRGTHSQHLISWWHLTGVKQYRLFLK